MNDDTDRQQIEGILEQNGRRNKNHFFPVLILHFHSALVLLDNISTTEELDEPGRLQVINELNQALGFSEVNVTT